MIAGWFFRRYGTPEVYLNGKRMQLQGWVPWYPWWLRLLQRTFPGPEHCFSRDTLEGDNVADPDSVPGSKPDTPLTFEFELDDPQNDVIVMLILDEDP